MRKCLRCETEMVEDLTVISGGASPSPTAITIVLSTDVRSVLTISDKICILSRTHIVTKYAPTEL